MRDTDKIITKFRETGLKITPQRMAIFELLKDNRDHPSVEDIYKEVLNTHPSISFTTVYKTLQTLRDMGEITELSVNPERVHYDPEVQDHVHTFCTACREIEDVRGMDNTVATVPDFSDMAVEFDVRQTQMHLVGVCVDCQHSA